MTTTTTPRDTSAAARPASGSLRRVTALARAEARLLVRNRTALFNALLLPLVMVAFFSFVGGAGNGDPVTAATSVLASLVSLCVLFVVYYNLTTAYVARREDRVLQRLLTGECRRPEILAAAAVPALLVTVAQVLVGYGAVCLLVEPPGLVNPVLATVGVLGGTLLFTVLAAATSGFSRTVESTQLTTLPVVVAVLPFAGVFGPPGATSGVLWDVARFTPLRPVVELVWLGVAGVDADGRTLGLAETFAAAALPVGVLAAWTVLGVLAARRWMRWEPRR
ncbi:ABC transporter permease [Isoptericola variabilis]|uniref:ABC-2 type transporter n=1 Tax=Isoptericola variabilis (strain 225) TaxID=743718 RepID=F6FUJ8_ISOV2|nr:ABC transporter permease [Isoptericola variabilis]AEG45425.1 ABC-2 type transporter [Isoptericola variabilis 225]TWH31554.1 ABC-2 type transport system permease protein [Isoptericola variabilis J7]